MNLYSENDNYKLYQGNMLDMLEEIEPETREINFDIQNKISSIIKILGSDKE